MPRESVQGQKANTCTLTMTKSFSEQTGTMGNGKRECPKDSGQDSGLQSELKQEPWGDYHRLRMERLDWSYWVPCI
jgi:hypothetical protein